MSKIGTMLFCLYVLTESIVASQMDPVTLNLSGTVSSISGIDLCSEIGKLKGVCSSTPGYQIILRSVDYEVIQGPNHPDYEKGITHHKDSLVIYSTDTLFRTLIGKTISISKYDLRGDEFSIRPSIETLKIADAISINNISHVDTGEKNVRVSTAGGMVRVSGIPAGKIWNLKIMNMAGRTVIASKGIAQGAIGEVRIGKLQPGVYLCHLNAGDLLETQSVRIVK